MGYRSSPGCREARATAPCLSQTAAAARREPAAPADDRGHVDPAVRVEDPAGLRPRGGGLRPVPWPLAGPGRAGGPAALPVAPGLRGCIAREDERRGVRPALLL